MSYEKTTQITACWDKNNSKKGASKIPSKSIFSHPNEYISRQKILFCHRIRYTNSFLKLEKINVFGEF